MDALLMRLDAPLMAFGGVIVDNLGITAPFPGRSMLTGLFANSLGYRHGESARLQELQSRLRYAVRCDRPGRPLLDFQTVDLSQTFLAEGWTTHGVPEGREGGPAAEGTHIRHRHYWADAVYTVAVALEPSDLPPLLQDLTRALEYPSRPLFLGRKACLPAAPLLLGTSSGPNLRAILASTPVVGDGRAAAPPWRAWWPVGEGTEDSRTRRIAGYDDRDWANQIHTGRRWMIEGVIGE